MSCKEMRANATRLSASCCQLTRPSLDTGYADCRDSLKLPKDRHFTFAELYTINMCLEECNYIGSGYIDVDPPFRLDMGRVKQNLEHILPQPKATTVAFMFDAYAKCEVYRAQHAARFALHLPDIEFIEEKCNPFALHVTICVRIHAMQKCPKEFYSPSAQCHMAQTFFTKCVDDIETNLS
ncbi:uncharacterized protein LOC115766193 [Drosophila novamexicana]|uniref:uncharacterized protein LOC115766193 n=1 Tax=Drosophila novamexicana TaxID=47314 RepID=UPI0011E600B2|nr:uncharacterized protein LOC115766193 [Drosophila novamexicana]